MERSLILFDQPFYDVFGRLPVLDVFLVQLPSLVSDRVIAAPGAAAFAAPVGTDEAAGLQTPESRIERRFIELIAVIGQPPDIAVDLIAVAVPFLQKPQNDRIGMAADDVGCDGSHALISPFFNGCSDCSLRYLACQCRDQNKSGRPAPFHGFWKRKNPSFRPCFPFRKQCRDVRFFPVLTLFEDFQMIRSSSCSGPPLTIAE